MGGAVIGALLLMAATWYWFPEQTEDGKDAMRVDGERIWR